MNYLFKHNSPVRVCNNFRGDDEKVVKNGLALSPSEVMEMVQRGIPISSSNLQLLEIYKTSDSDFTVPMEFRRNADMSDMFQHREEVRSKVRQASEKHLSNLKSVENVGNE